MTSSPEYQRERRKFLRDNNLCVACKAKTTGTAYCTRCANKYWKDRNTYKKEYRQKRTQNGLCSCCGGHKEESRKNRRVCTVCKIRQSDNQRFRRRERVERNKCAQCAEPLNSKYTRCAACLYKQRKARSVKLV